MDAVDALDPHKATEQRSVRGSPTDAMWAGAEDGVEASQQVGWDDVDAGAAAHDQVNIHVHADAAAARLPPAQHAAATDAEMLHSALSGGAAGDGRASRVSGEADSEGLTPVPQGGGLHFDVGAWHRGMGDMISAVGAERPQPLVPLPDRVADAQNRLRILEGAVQRRSATAVRAWRARPAAAAMAASCRIIPPSDSAARTRVQRTVTCSARSRSSCSACSIWSGRTGRWRKRRSRRR